MIAYIDDFKLMMVLTLLTIPFLLLIKRAKPEAGAHPRGARMNKTPLIALPLALLLGACMVGPDFDARDASRTDLCGIRRYAAAGGPAARTGKGIEGEWWPPSARPLSTRS